MAKLLAALAGAGALSLCATAGQALSVPETPVSAPLPSGTQTRTVSLTRVATRMEPGLRWASLKAGPLCTPDGRLAWRESGGAIGPAEFKRVFADQLRAAGFRVDGDPDSLFEEAANFSEYSVAGAIRDARGDLCFAGRAPRLHFGDSNRVKGSAVLNVEWQVYSRLQRQVIARIPVQAGVEVRDSMDGGADAVLLEAFAETVKALVASDAFRDIFIGAPRSLEEAVRPPRLAPIALQGPETSGPVEIADAVGSVVLILAGDGHGSGFLASRDGYVLTDQHVIGAARQVTVRWPDGIETVGEVVRSDRVRDVALIKTDPRGREPLPLRLDSMRPGETVFAIGAPLETRFQNTITRGVVSAYRTIDGLRYLQSDTTVNPGGSGGPLLDERGAVVAMTKSIYRIDAQPTGINFFTPVRDALEFLGAASGG